MRASQKLIEYIKKAEGCRLSAYPDAKGVMTIGYGHTKNVKVGDRISQSQAEQYLKDDLRQFEAVVDKVRNVNTQGRYDALVDFVYNCGPTNFAKSTLKKYIEAGKATWMIQEQFLLWVNSGGKKLGGLVSQRIWEAARFAE